MPDPGLVDAVNVALVLGKPLLLTGDPGTGKTQLAYSLAWQLASRKRRNVNSELVEKFETKSTSVARDLFYSFDAIRRFQAARPMESPIAPAGSVDSGSNAPYITYNALGRSLLRALRPSQLTIPPPSDILTGEPSRTVVLIDEIDKAPRDFPNDILNELDEMYFRIPELDNAKVGGRGILDPAFKPIVVLTSNSERHLPDPFLRRCIYFHIPFPEKEPLQAILLSRLSQFPGARGALVNDALEFFLKLRESKALKRAPSPAELIEWIAYMLHSDVQPGTPVAKAKDVAFAGLSALAKEEKDQPAIREELKRFIGD